MYTKSLWGDYNHPTPGLNGEDFNNPMVHGTRDDKCNCPAYRLNPIRYGQPHCPGWIQAPLFFFF